eukprot:GILI01012758.1.p1 GENE.GILI01012758.1~~GILI01012758.1.p1  ORF type:complete len:261 (-),score=46.20 GILI01012758.1:55-837(-)
MQKHLELANLTGRGFSLSEATSIQHQARIISDSLKQPTVTVWGKILGVTADYIIIRCMGRDLLGTVHTLYSIDGGLSFNALDTSVDKFDDLCALVKGPFIGDVAYEYKVNAIATGVPTPIREAHRLSWFIRSCDEHCRVCPRGAVLHFEDGAVTTNKAFEGLDRDVAGRADSFVHLRNKREAQSALQREGVLTKLDFLDPITYDMPKSVWNISYDATNDVVFGSNALYLGAIFYHTPETKTWGSIYVGDGNLNTNLAFML